MKKEKTGKKQGRGKGKGERKKRGERERRKENTYDLMAHPILSVMCSKNCVTRSYIGGMGVNHRGTQYQMSLSLFFVVRELHAISMF